MLATECVLVLHRESFAKTTQEVSRHPVGAERVQIKTIPALSMLAVVNQNDYIKFSSCYLIFPDLNVSSVANY